MNGDQYLKESGFGFFGISKRKLRGLLDVIPAIIRESNLDKLLQIILEKAAEVMAAQRASIFLLDKEKNELWTRVTAGGDVEEIRISADKGIVGAVVQSQDTLVIKDAYDDPRFEQSVDQGTGFRTRAILAMPIVGQSNNVIGVIEVLNRKGWRKSFNKSDVRLMAAFTTLVAITLQNSIYLDSLIKSLDSLSRYTKTLEKYTHQQILEMLQNKVDPTKAAPKQEPRAILFCDIRGFTSRSKDMTASELSDYLNHFFGVIQNAIIAHEGKIEKLIGDSVMASFQNCDNALLAARRFMDDSRDIENMECGIGLSWGDVMIGNIGGEGKLDYTLVGDVVNLASRFEKLNKNEHIATNINFSAGFYDMLSPELKEVSTRQGLFRIRGLDKPIAVYGSH